ncbi:hypothetical protein [Blastococcus sp. LR1]|uniref:hypothetical protein n=1 Tax=Blastococcus sp. LR1 TaxID=2877000 RepID=UPI001CCE4821|nr:hypothetical protein [Blastococcus sp. LR1]MCA0146701.1 hypothetical protein [Blastococcus sp. LR1]
MVVVPAVVAVALLAGLAVLQVALIAGAPLGHLTWGGAHQVLPRRRRFGSAAAIVLYVLFALVVWDTALLASDPELQSGPNLGIWLLTAYFAVSILPNAFSRSRAERLVMTPVSAALAVSCLALALQA